MEKWKKVILKPDDTMQLAIKVLTKEALQIIMVSDYQDRLIGTVTDGDIRRALINHLDLSTPLEKIMNHEPISGSILDSKDKLFSIMNAKNLLQIPILDEKGLIVGLEIIQNLLKKPIYDNPVFLMAGGFGKRLNPLTNNVPKPLLNVGKKPILETIIEQFIQCGFHNFFISTHYKSEMLKNHFGNGSNWGVSIQYIHEESPLGTAGSLGLLPNNISNLPILMMNGDVLTKVNFDNLLNNHIKSGAIATVCSREYDLQVPYGVIQSKGQEVQGIVEKPIHKFFVNAGIYVLDPSIIKILDGVTKIDMPDLLTNQIQQNKKVNTFPIYEYWIDIGHLEEYERANTEINNLFNE
jgi:dTDP-glucose pyrophosphorylase/CBS domain-containing protein